MRELIEIAYDYPLVFLQICHDHELVSRMERSTEKPTWRKPGEKAVNARDRLRREREMNKRRLGVA